MRLLRIHALCRWHDQCWWISGHASADTYVVQHVLNEQPLVDYMADEPIRLSDPASSRSVSSAGKRSSCG